MHDATANSTAIGANAVGEPMRAMDDIGMDVRNRFRESCRSRDFSVVPFAPGVCF